MSDENASTNYDEQFNKYLNKLAKLKKEYLDIVNKVELSKEKDTKYKDTIKILIKNLITLYPRIENKRNKYIINNYSIDFINKEIKNPLTRENLGKYLYKYFCDKYDKDNKTEEEIKNGINNHVTEVLNHIEKERFVENILSIKISKKKKVDYSVT